MGRFPPDFKTVVAQEHGRTIGYVWACREPGLEACRFEASLASRNFQDISGEALAKVKLPSRWLMGFLIVADGDIVVPLQWARHVETDERRRIVFFLGPGVNHGVCSDAIAETAAGCRIDNTTALADLTTAHNVHARYGEYHSRQAYEDRGL